MQTLEERLARLEAQREAEMKDAAEVRRKLDKIDGEVEAINSKLDRQKGFIAGALSVLTFIWGVVAAVAVAGYNYFIGKGDFP